MARPKSVSLKYYWVKINFDSDYRFQLAEELIHTNGGSNIECLAITRVYSQLLSAIYGNGYYIQYTPELALQISSGMRQFGIRTEHVNRIVMALIHSGLFNIGLYETYEILSSYEVQGNWKKAMGALRRVSTVKPEFVISSEETPHFFGSNQGFFGIKGGSLGKEGGFSISQSDIRQSDSLTVNQTEARTREIIEPAGQQGTGPGRNPPVAPAPLALEPIPQKEWEEVGLNERRLPDECAALYLNHPQFRESRFQVMTRVGVTDYTVFQKWVLSCFVDWLKSGKMNQAKTMEDFVEHLMSWFKTIDMTQTPEEYLESQKPKVPQRKPVKPQQQQSYVPTTNIIGDQQDFSKQDNKTMHTKF